MPELQDWKNPPIKIPGKIKLDVDGELIEVSFPKFGDVKEITKYIDLVQSLRLIESDPNIVA